jgi:serine/threonine protein kinase
MGKFELVQVENKAKDVKIEAKSFEEKTNCDTITKDELSSIDKFEKVLNPEFLENFELEELVGYGSESYVYRTKIRRNKKVISMKMIIREKEEKKNINELRISKKLKNKNIIDIYAASPIFENVDCIMMEYARYGNIRDFQREVLRSNILSESLLCYLAYQILKALKHCHICKIAHLDLKPQNIVIDRDLNAKLIDFSISIDYSKINSKTIQLPFKGTNFYIAPEVHSSKTIKVKDINKVDLYSLGVILYNLAFGSYPFGLNREDADDYFKIYRKIMNDFQIKNDLGYSEYFIDFLNKLLERDINKRINIDKALQHHWIKGADILFNEKEKLCNMNSFFVNLKTDYFKEFNDYLKKKLFIHN